MQYRPFPKLLPAQAMPPLLAPPGHATPQVAVLSDGPFTRPSRILPSYISSSRPLAYKLLITKLFPHSKSSLGLVYNLIPCSCKCPFPRPSYRILWLLAPSWPPSPQSQYPGTNPSWANCFMLPTYNLCFFLNRLLQGLWHDPHGLNHT